MRKRVVIMGAAGRDFHNFNVYFRDRQEYEVVAFTGTQIPGIEGRPYPPELAGSLYPKGIPIYSENELPRLIKEFNVDIVVFSYSDVSHEYVMQKASLVLGSGADFMLLGPNSTMLESNKPVISICATRTGSGKSQTTRKISELLKQHGKKVVVVRHPMPYGDLAQQTVQRFATYADLDKHKCTIEEREEYEPHIKRNTVVYAGVDYEKILRGAEKEADIILWDGGNNDFSFYKSDLLIVVVDPLRVGNELTYYPGETTLRLADVVIVNKVDTAEPNDVSKLKANVKQVNPKATIIEAASPISVDNQEIIKDKKVIVVEDGPTLTHGGMSYGAGIVAAKRFGAKEIIDPRPYAVGSIKETYQKYPKTGKVLPAMGYGTKQMEELEATINSILCDSVIIATPVDLKKILKIEKPSTRVTYELEEIGDHKLSEIIKKFSQGGAN
jgi:predicted GTPase